jgi:hypothetical protein
LAKFRLGWEILLRRNFSRPERQKFNKVKIKNKMSIKRTIITTATIVVSVAMIASVACAQTPTVAQLMAEIAALQAQLQSLSGSSTTTTTTGSLPAACVGVTFARNLVVGSTGSDIKCLQALLNLSASTQVSATGAGSPGSETTYFGVKTLAAVKIYQVNKGFTPANQVGPLTRGALNAQLGGSSSTTTTTTTTTGTTTQTGSISVMLASDSPASAAIVGNQASADLAHFNFTGTGTVTSITLQRSGISDQNTLTNVYLYDGNTRITDGYSFNVSGQIVMNGLSIAVNGSKTISVKADIESYVSSYASSVIITLTSYTANGSTMNVNVSGNPMMAASGTLATIYLGANTVTSTSASPTTINSGTSQYTVWSAPIQVNTRAVLLKMANFKMVGSAPSNALANIRLFIDGTDTGKIATVITINGSNYASFDLTSAPITLTTGSHTADVRADIYTGAARTVQLSVQQASDLTIADPQVGVNIAILGASGAAFTSNLGAYISINQGSGTVVVDPTFTSATNISAGATNAIIGRFVIHGYGEDVKINSINVTPELTPQSTAASAVSKTSGTADTAGAVYTVTIDTTGFVAGNTVTIGAATGTVSSVDSTTSMTVTLTVSGAVGATPTVAVVDKGLNNVTLYFNGSQISSQQSPTATSSALTFQLGSQMIVPAGQDSTLEVRADLQSTSNVAYGGGTIKVKLPTETSANAQGQSSQNTISVPSGNVETTGLTIQSATLAVSQNTSYAAQSVSPNTANVRIGSFIAQNQSTSESVRLTTLTVALTSNGTDALSAGALTGLTSLRTSDTTGSGSTPIQPSASNTFSVNDTLAPGASMVIDIFANTGAAATVPNIYAKLTVASIGVTSNISSAGSAVTGQHIALGTGTLQTPVIVASSTTPEQFIASAGGAANASQATFNFISTGGSAIINELKFSATSGTVSNICVGSVCAQPVSGTADLTGLSLAVPNGSGGLLQNVQVSYVPVGTSGVAPNVVSTIALTYVKYQAGGTTATLSTASTGGINTHIAAVTGNTVILVGSKPTVVTTSTTNAGLNIGAENKIGEVTVTADPKGAIKLNDIKFNIGSANFGSTLTFTGARIADGSTTITGSQCGQGIADAASQTIFCEFGTPGDTFVSTSYTASAPVNTEMNTDFDGYQIPSGTSKTFSLFATVAGTVTSATTGSISTSVDSTGFNWDDASYATFVADGSATSGSSGTVNAGTDGTNLNGLYIYNFPTASYTIHQ